MKFYNLSKIRSYKRGTSIPVIFGEILGEEGISEGYVEIVDVIKDEILASYPVKFVQR